MRELGRKGAEAAPLPLDGAIAALAARQHGVISRAQLRALGLGDDAITKRAGRGRLHRVHRGVYAVGHPVLGSRGDGSPRSSRAGRELS